LEVDPLNFIRDASDGKGMSTFRLKVQMSICMHTMPWHDIWPSKKVMLCCVYCLQVYRP
jgi:hypothetical protein